MGAPPVSLPFLFRRVSLWVWLLPRRKVADPMWPSVIAKHKAVNMSCKQHSLEVIGNICQLQEAASSALDFAGQPSRAAPADRYTI